MCDKARININFMFTSKLFSFNLDLPLTLVVSQNETDVTELDTGYISVVTVCFYANVSASRRNDAVFELILDNMTTATLDEDFTNNNTLYITIPYGFYGNFSECADLVIVGDDVYEENEIIVYTISPQAEQDSVEYEFGMDSLTVTIIDDDG